MKIYIDQAAAAAICPPIISARQVRLWLVTRAGITMAQVEEAIDGIPDPTLREATRVEWEYGTQVHRDHSMILAIAAALGLDEAQVNQAFREAALL